MEYVLEKYTKVVLDFNQKNIETWAALAAGWERQKRR